ncbi:hypothetical protein HY635_02630 [Candidatus Uhrbacteria bacterium]|nr:hypothetical protein [Candidatus Uhrbacteria bacterium]
MEQIIGHADILTAFDRLISTDRLGHAYLLVGSEGVGKATVATWIAARLLCAASGQRPCGRCDACMAIERRIHPDVYTLRAGGTAIGIDAVREWTTALSRTSLFAGWKIGIVEGAEELTEAAANACLKAIEEPTPRTLILLTAPSRRQVIATIASRCALVACRRVPRTDLESALCEHGAASTEARAIAETADGCPGIAMTLLRDVELRTSAENVVKTARAAMSGSWTERLRRVDALLRDRTSDRSAMEQSARKLIDAFRCLGRQQLRTTNSATPEFSRWMELLARAPDHLAANVSPRLLIETIAVTYPTENF